MGPPAPPGPCFGRGDRGRPAGRCHVAAGLRAGPKEDIPRVMISPGGCNYVADALPILGAIWACWDFETVEPYMAIDNGNMWHGPETGPATGLGVSVEE